MANDTVEKKGDSQCRSCKKVFHHSDLKIAETERYGIIIKEKVCPYCGSRTYGLIDYPVKEEDLIYKRNIHRNTDKTFISCLDRLTDCIITKDIGQRFYDKLFSI